MNQSFCSCNASLLQVPSFPFHGVQNQNVNGLRLINTAALATEHPSMKCGKYRFIRLLRRMRGSAETQSTNCIISSPTISVVSAQRRPYTIARHVTSSERHRSVVCSVINQAPSLRKRTFVDVMLIKRYEKRIVLSTIQFHFCISPDPQDPSPSFHCVSNYNILRRSPLRLFIIRIQRISGIADRKDWYFLFTEVYLLNL